MLVGGAIALLLAFGTVELDAAHARESAATVALGERLFDDVRFSQAFRDRDVRTRVDSRGAPSGAVSCRSCHFTRRPSTEETAAAHVLAFADDAPRSRWPQRNDGRPSTPRNSPSLVDVAAAHGRNALMHFDAEFGSMHALVRETFLGRNFGWLPHERAAALRHLARVVREDNGPAPRLASSSALELDLTQATDEQIADRVAELVIAFLESLRFSRDREGRHDGSPYDAFLAANRLARAPAPGESPPEYARRLGEQIAVLRAPKFVDDPARRLQVHDQPFRFGELELRGMRVFFRGAISPAQKSGAGNCAECHPPPHFSDFKFHNTGVAQDEYDSVHGTGAFARVDIPDLAARTAALDRWLPPARARPHARGPFLAPADSSAPGRTDLGLWNVYANPDLPVPQRALEQLLNSSGQLPADAVLARTIARFKTSMLRSPGQSAPYFHTGHARTIEDVIQFYRRMSGHAHAGNLRNAPPEYFAMRLGAEDVAPLAAFLRALNEDYVPSEQGGGGRRPDRR